MFSCLQILEAFLWFVLITLLNVTLIILTLSVSRLLNLLLRLVAFLLFLNPQCLASISRWITSITIPLTLSNLKLLRRITRTENILHRNFTRRQVAIQNRVASNIGISQSTFSVKVLNLFSRSRRKTNKR